MKKPVTIITLFAGLLFAIFLFSGCEKQEKEISGDSILKVVNNCTFSVSIYFDNDFIGKVEKESNRTWSVPSGKHEVRASSVTAGVSTENPTFYDGVTTVITVSQNGKSGDNLLNIFKTDQVIDEVNIVLK